MFSPEYPLDFLPEPFNYDLRPGQGIVLVTKKGGQFSFYVREAL